MKILIICLFFINQQNSVMCPIVKKLLDDFREFGVLVSAVFHGITERLHNALDDSSEDSAGEKNKPEFETFGIVPAMSANINEPEPITYYQLKKHPSALLSTDRLILYHERLPQIHRVLTADGFYLIVHQLLVPNGVTIKRTILLHHGLFGSSADWLMLGEESLPYLLSDAGYDVWMVNARGNYYSQNHKKIHISSAQFWNFTWQEMGQYDLPAVLDYIRKIRGDQEKIDFIGHSMGATALLVLLSTKETKEYNDYIRMGILMAPLTFMSETKGPFRAIVKNKLILNDSIGEYFPRRRVPIELAKKYCRSHRLYCNNPLFFLAGGLHYTSPLNRDREFLATLLSHVPAGASIKTVMHYAQIAQSGKFHEYGDFRKEFALRDIKVPIALFSSIDDDLCSVASANKLYVNIENPIEHVVFNGQNMTHTEFVWGHRANELVFSKILELVKSTKPNDIRTKLNEV